MLHYNESFKPLVKAYRKHRSYAGNGLFGKAKRALPFLHTYYDF